MFEVSGLVVAQNIFEKDINNFRGFKMPPFEKKISPGVNSENLKTGVILLLNRADYKNLGTNHKYG